MDLPMIEFACDLFAEDALEDYYIIGVQHLLVSTVSMFKALFKKGLKLANLSLLGKCYSTESKAYFELLKEGIDISPDSIKFDSHKDFDETHRSSIKAFLEERKHRIQSKKYKKIIVLDDGGELIEYINDLLDSHDNIIGMEQTSSGFRRLQNKTIKFPVINTARSKAKLSIETDRVVSLGLEKMEKHLKKTDQIEKVLILGQGPVGSTIHSQLKDNYSVFRFDYEVDKSDITIEEFNNKLKDFDLIIGCTGVTSISKDQHKYLKKGVILVSLSSMDREFDASHLRKKHPKMTSCWNHLDCNGINLINMGFPISFDCPEDIDDPLFFQFTRSLIMSAIYQATNTSTKAGFIDLDENLQNSMIEKFQEYRVNSV